MKPRLRQHARAIALAASILLLLAAVTVYAFVRPSSHASSGSARVEPEYIQTALRELSIPFQVLPPGSNVRSEGEFVLEPTNPVSVCADSDRPTFAWTDPSSGSSYRVTIYSGEREIVESDPIHEKLWTPPIDLPEDQELNWFVEDLNQANRVSLQARFRILSATQQSQLRHDLEQTAGRPLSHAIVLGAYGLIDRALTELDQCKDPRGSVFAAGLRDRRRLSNNQE